MVLNPSLPLGESLPHPILLSSLVVEGSREKISFKKKIHEVPQTVNSTKEHPETAELKTSLGRIIGSCSLVNCPGEEIWLNMRQGQKSSRHGPEPPL